MYIGICLCQYIMSALIKLSSKINCRSSPAWTYCSYPFKPWLSAQIPSTKYIFVYNSLAYRNLYAKITGDIPPNLQVKPTIYIYIYIYMEHSQFADFFFVNAARIQNVIYTLEGDFSVARQRLSYFVFLSVFQQFILRSTSNHISSLLTNLFNKYGYHFSFHRSMMKEFTIISTPDLCFILFTDVW